MRVEFGIGKASGTVTAPPSKSFAHRLLIAGALRGERCCIRNVAFPDDILRTLDCLRALGFRFEKGEETVMFSGVREVPEGEITMPCGESGSTLRFMVPVALALGGKFRFTGTERLIARGIGGYGEMLKDQGIVCEIGTGFILLEGRLGPGEYHIDVTQSSQYLTGLLLAQPIIPGESRIVTEGRMESRSYIDITEAAVGQTTVEGDWSNAAFLEAFNLFGGKVKVTGLNPDSVQGDRRCLDFFAALKEGFATIDISENIDLGPVLFAVAALLHGAEITGTRRLALKESDRVSAMLEELSAFGVRYSRDNNSVTIYESPLHAPGRPLYGHNDHRIVMALALPLSLFGGRIEGAEAVRKSFPDFFETLGKIGIKTKIHAD